MLETRPAFYKKTFQYRFEMNYIIFRFHLDTTRDFSGLPGENKNESWHKTDLYVGAIQIETFCLNSLEKWTEVKKHLFGILWPEWNFNLHVRI